MFPNTLGKPATLQEDLPAPNGTFKYNMNDKRS